MVGLLEGFTLGSILAGLISGLWANNTERAVHAGYKSFISYLKQGGKPVNHDLQKAIKRSLLQAMRELARECRDEQAGRFPTFTAMLPFFSKQHSSEVRWLNQQIAQWSKDLKAIERKEFIETPIILPEEIGLLLTSEDRLSVEVIQKIKGKFLAEVLKDNKSRCYEKKVRQETAGLFELVSAYFAEEIKNNQQVRNIFEGELLVQINANLKAHINASQGIKPLTLEDLEEPLSNINQVMVQVGDKLTQLENLIKDITERLTDPKEDRYRLEVVLNTEAFSIIYEAKAKAITAYLRQLSADSSLTIVGIEQGSIILVLEGSQKGVERLEDLYKSAQLSEILGLRVKDIRCLDSQVRTSQEKAQISIDSYLRSQSQIEKILQEKLNIVPEEKLFGIEENLEILREYLQDRTGSWFISVTGEGGIGKTSIVEKLVRENVALSGFEKLAWITAKRVYFSLPTGETEDIGNTLSIETMIYEVAKQLDIILPAARDDQFPYLQEKLRKTPYLVVIDNLETLEEYKTLFSKFKANNPRNNFRPSKVIFTSRVALKGTNIDVRELGIKGLSEKASLELIQYQGRDIQLIQNSNYSQLLPIYHKTEGNPLLIKLVVSMIRNYDSPLYEIIDALNRQEELLRYLYGVALGEISEKALKVIYALTEFSQSSTVSCNDLKAASGLENNELIDAIRECLQWSLLFPISRKLNEKPSYSIHNLLYEYLNGPIT